ncbi:dickkopf-related protein 3-like [Xenopus laevis]|uniref:Dickkopf-related protein 3-like n=1 Tax=Xenopus laevis TaxID=8355 RepID=A0A8J1LDM6_XENLA|nr:dickkopf-related protein 3-like [Xenopus laevis]
MMLLPLVALLLPLPLCSWAAALLRPDSHGPRIMRRIDSQQGCQAERECPPGMMCISGNCTEPGCQAERECPPGMMCISGNCTEPVTDSGIGGKCDPNNDQCEPEFCCSKTEAGKLPVCAPFPAEGERCRIQPISLFNLLQTDSTAESELSYCPCAAGLVCTNNGFNLISTCEKPEEVLDFTTYGTESLLQPLVRRDEELTYYDSDLIPWPSQPDQLMVNLPRAAEESARESEHVLKALSEDVAGNLEEESLHLDQHTHEQPDPSPLEFLELKQLAKNIGQYGFY